MGLGRSGLGAEPRCRQFCSAAVTGISERALAPNDDSALLPSAVLNEGKTVSDVGAGELAFSQARCELDRGGGTGAAASPDSRDRWAHLLVAPTTTLANADMMWLQPREDEKMPGISVAARL